MPRGALLCALAVVAALVGCDIGDARTCGPDGTGEQVDDVAATFGVTEFVAEVRTPGAAAFLWAPEASQFPDEAIHVLCLGDRVNEAGSSQIPLLSDVVAATATRIGASISGLNGEFTVEPGYLLGIVNRETVVSLEVAWTTPASDEEARWEVGVDPGFLLVPVPAGVPPEATFTYRFLDEDGEAVWVERDGS